MEKKMILAAAAVLVSAAGFAGINASSATDPATDLLRENAEILGIDPDEIVDFHKGCLSDGPGCILSPTRYYPTYLGMY